MDSKNLQPEVVDGLAELLTEERRQRMDAVLDRRLISVCPVLEDFHDEHNVAAVLRSAESLGVQDVHVVERGRRVKVRRRAAAGAERWLSVHRHDRLAACLGALQSQGFEIWGADLGPGAVPVDELDVSRPLALVFGSERRGLSPVARRLVDGRFTVPMHGFTESFNVSVASALALTAVCTRRRAWLGRAGDLDAVRRQELRAHWLQLSVRRSAQVTRLLQDRLRGGEENP